MTIAGYINRKCQAQPDRVKRRRLRAVLELAYDPVVAGRNDTDTIVMTGLPWSTMRELRQISDG